MSEVTTWYLEMRDPEQLRPAPPPRRPVELRQATVPSPEFARFLYTAVGGDWYWTEREVWTYGRWEELLERPQTSIWVAYCGGNPAGFAELDVQPLPGGAPGTTQVEVRSFGLLPQFRGQGLGGWLLTETLRQAWALGAQRVWLHTCDLDGPAALPNYRARGLVVFDERTEDQFLPPQPTGPWVGARP